MTRAAAHRPRPTTHPRRTGHRPTTTTATRRALLVLVAALVLLAGACGSDDDADTTDATTTAAVGATTAIEAEGEGGAATGSITVFAAASLTDVYAEIGEAFEEANPGASVEFSFGPSSGLVTQITEGAPADVIATASTSTMDDLVDADALDGDPVDFATNQLEIAVPPDNPGEVEGLADLANEDLIVALCAEEVPCGRFAREALAGIDVEPSIDTNEQDVRALLTKIQAGEVDVGVVYETDVVAAGDDALGIPIPEDENVVATYPLALTEQVEDAATGQAFIDFVLSDEGQASLADAGFGPP